MAFVAAGSAPGQGHIELPFRETFHGRWDAGWKPYSSKDNRLEIVGGKLRITARTNTYAHLSRLLGVDSVRAAAWIKPGEGSSWCTSLFLYWGAGNWCQMGVVPGARYLAVEAVDGEVVATEMGGCDANASNGLAVELGRDVVRWYTSADGRSWTLSKSIRRPKAWKGAPARLIVGKGYGTGTAAYPNADLDNDYADPGSETTSFIDNVTVERTNPKLLSVGAQDRRLWSGAMPDEAGNAVLALQSDPSFDLVKSLFPSMKNGREAIGVKDHPYEIEIEPDGAVLFGNRVTDPDAPRAHWEIGLPARRVGGPSIPIKKETQGWAPVSLCVASDRGLRLRAYAWAWSENMSPDNPTWAFLKLTIRNTTTRELRVPVSLKVDAQPIGLAPLIWDVPIGPGETRSVVAKAPYEVVGKGFTKVDPHEESSVVKQFVDGWTRTLAPSVKLVLPEPRVEMMWRKSLVNNFINVDKVNGAYEPHDGSGFYEEVYGISAALYCEALDLWGFHEDAKRYLDSLFAMVKPDGLFEVNSGYCDMGTLLKVASSHLFLTQDAAWFKSVAPKMVLVADWLAKRRRLSKRLIAGKRPVTYGLINYRPYCDYPSPTTTYMGDCYGAVGMEWAARAFARVGLMGESQSLAKEGAAYRADILASMKAGAFVHNGVKMLPMEPDTRRLLKDNGYTGGDYYGLIAPIVLETDFLPPSSPYAQMIVRQMEDRKGLILRMSRFRDGIDHAYTYGYWLNLLERDQVRPVLVGFYGTLAYGMSRETFSAVECTAIRTGINDATTPHTYSGTQQLRLLRMMLVREDGDTLWLAQATPRAWLANGKTVSLKGAPTYFGPVSFTIVSEASKGRIIATVDTPKSPDLRSVKLRLRCPEGFRLASVTVDGRRVRVVNETITLRPGLTGIKVVARVVRG